MPSSGKVSEFVTGFTTVKQGVFWQATLIDCDQDTEPEVAGRLDPDRTDSSELYERVIAIAPEGVRDDGGCDSTQPIRSVGAA